MFDLCDSDFKAVIEKVTKHGQITVQQAHEQLLENSDPQDSH